MIMRWLRHFSLPLYFVDPIDPALPPVGDPAPTPTPEPRERRACCEFCECSLTTRGEVLKVSDKARAFRDQAERLTDRDREIAQLKTDNADLKAKLAAATAPASRAPVRVALGGR